MKKIIAIVLVVCMLWCFAGCSEVTDNIRANKVSELGFVLIEEFGSYGSSRTYLVYDPNTMVEYLFYTADYDSISMCPYYDSDGNVVIYKGE